MPTTLERRADERAEWLSRRIDQEIHSARKACGWSQRELAARAGVDQSAVSRVERGWTRVSVALLSRLTVELALDFSARVYPADDVVLRDERQLRQVGLIVARKGAAWHASLEARVGVDSRDHRAIDIMLATALEVWAVEVERDLSNFQEQLRGDLLKRDRLAHRPGVRGWWASANRSNRALTSRLPRAYWQLGWRHRPAASVLHVGPNGGMD
jgi:transcriptional regulator with XRE-family HTH domain